MLRPRMRMVNSIPLSSASTHWKSWSGGIGERVRSAHSCLIVDWPLTPLFLRVGTKTLIACGNTLDSLRTFSGWQTTFERYFTDQFSTMFSFLRCWPRTDCRFSDTAPNVVHMSVKPQEVIDDEENAKSAKGKNSGGGGRPGSRGDGDEPTAGCRCIVQWSFHVFLPSSFLSASSLWYPLPPNSPSLLSSALHTPLLFHNLHFPFLFSSSHIYRAFFQHTVRCNGPKISNHLGVERQRRMERGEVSVVFRSCGSFLH